MEEPLSARSYERFESTRSKRQIACMCSYRLPEIALALREIAAMSLQGVPLRKLALRQVRARLYGEARQPGRGRVEHPNHQLAPSIKKRIVNRFPIFLGSGQYTLLARAKDARYVAT
jgi:hypothetical protein